MLHPWRGLTHLDFSRPEKPSGHDGDVHKLVDERGWDDSLARVLRFLPSLALLAARNTPAGTRAVLCRDETQFFYACMHIYCGYMI